MMDSGTKDTRPITGVETDTGDTVTLREDKSSGLEGTTHQQVSEIRDTTGHLPIEANDGDGATSRSGESRLVAEQQQKVSMTDDPTSTNRTEGTVSCQGQSDLYSFDDDLIPDGQIELQRKLMQKEAELQMLRYRLLQSCGSERTDSKVQAGKATIAPGNKVTIQSEDVKVKLRDTDHQRRKLQVWIPVFRGCNDK